MEDLTKVTLKNVCCTCLSTDRTLSRLCRTHDGAIFDSDVTQLNICWECSGKMQGFTRFRDQACIAQSKLADIADGKVTYSKIKSLSTLSRCHQNDSFDEYPINEELPENFVDFGPHIEDIKIEYDPSAFSTDLNNYMYEQENFLHFNPDLNNGVEIKIETPITDSQINYDYRTDKAKKRKTEANKILRDDEVSSENKYNSKSECSDEDLNSDGGVTRNNKMKVKNKHLRKRKANKIMKSIEVLSGNIYRSGGENSDNNAEEDLLNSDVKVTSNNRMKSKNKSNIRNAKANKVIKSNEVLSGNIYRNSKISDNNAEEDLLNSDVKVTSNNRMKSKNKSNIRNAKAKKVIKSNEVLSGNIYRNSEISDNNADEDLLNSDEKGTSNNKMKGKNKTITGNTKANKIMKNNEVSSGNIYKSSEISDSNVDEDLLNSEGRVARNNNNKINLRKREANKIAKDNDDGESSQNMHSSEGEFSNGVTESNKIKDKSNVSLTNGDKNDISDDYLDSVDSAEVKITDKRKNENSIPIANADTNEIGITIANDHTYSKNHKSL
ncbi:protein PFC0760c-like isoform X2 [Bicyclus anynana]|uniref:Protein PFC0760c-like isoform X2 n=1 Tax=Bicyclus anynana TaxID=110368 RepID=A0ABM3M4F5_BICAN|nr:protein PFC0760c-like isoform X2 [Bicyclus anynana]